MGKRRKLAAPAAAEPAATANSQSAAAPPALVAELVDRDWLFGFTPESERALREVIALFKQERYMSTPDDILHMSDLPGREVWVAKLDGAIVAACELSLEGNGVPRAKQQQLSVNWVVQNTYPTSNFGDLAGVCVEQSGGEWEHLAFLLEAVHGAVKRGEQLCGAATPLAYMSVRRDIEDFPRFRLLKFKPVALLEPEESMRFKILLIRSKSAKEYWCEVFCSHFLRQLLYWLSSAFKDIPAAVLTEVLQSCEQSQERVCKKEGFDLHVAAADLGLLVSDQSLRRLRSVDPASWADLREHLDVVQVACLLHFGGYIQRQPLSPAVCTSLIEIGLQHKLERPRRGELSDHEVEGMRKFFQQILA